MRPGELLLTILAMGVVTYLPRLLPVQVLSSRQLPPRVVTWLKLVPIAVLAALVVSSVLPSAESQSAESNGIVVWACLATVLVAWRTRSLLGSVAVGVGTVALARLASDLF